MLTTLSYRLPRESVDRVLGSLTAYQLTAEFQQAWDRLPVRRHKAGPSRTPPYRSLSVALRAATGQPVALLVSRDPGDEGTDPNGAKRLLLTSKPIGYQLPIAVRTWERCVRGGDPVDSLSCLLPDPEPARRVAEYLRYRRNAVPLAPNWVFRTAEWQVMRRLAGSRLPIDGRPPLALRMDTDGSLITWAQEDLIRYPTNQSRGLARISLTLATHPGCDDLVLRFDAHHSRLRRDWPGTRNAWIDRDDPAGPILRLPVRAWKDRETGEVNVRLATHVPEVLAACELDPILLPHTLPDEPGSVRPQAGKAWGNSLGNGLGARFMLRLHEHICDQLPELVPLACPEDPRIKLAQRVTGRTAQGLTARMVLGSGFEKVRIVCLYSTLDARARMVTELRELAPRAGGQIEDGAEVALNERLTATMIRQPELLAHGYANRARLIGGLDALRSRPGDLAAAWLETEYHPEVPVVDDSKDHLRRTLAAAGIPSQFLATEPRVLPEKVRPMPESSKPHAATAAMRDLLRSAGVIDHRLPNALTSPRLQHRLDRPALLVGLHVRRQQTGSDEKPLVLTMVAIEATPTADAPWRIRMSSTTCRQWHPMGTALARFHAGPIGDASFGRSETKSVQVREFVEERLRQLVSAAGGELPVIIFADATASRTLWSGLNNQKFGEGELPGDTLVEAGHDVAVVRCDDTGSGGSVRPVTRTDRKKRPADPLQPAAPGRAVYRLDDSTEPVWIFPGVSKRYAAKAGRTGALYTRWTLPKDDYQAMKLREPWHAYTAIEIAVARPGSWDPVALAAFAARLCEQSVSWDGRTRSPVPLHLAKAADHDHPYYRTSEETEDDANPDDS
ncbi:RNaseH domain-containing protein [Kribbella sp. NPDC003505]|uniref:RNaseH domain-containing protein n=1 Tax=Kribbella sp. NPDC003505 TaxID=3154448 RepID=UPI0033AAD155